MSGVSLDLSAIGSAIAAVVVASGTVIGGAYAWWLKNKRNQADVRADVATSAAQQVVADAQRTVYQTLLERVTTLEADMRIVRDELSVERKHSRKLELHIWKLENLMRAANMEPPVFDGARS
jgi:hypothetical protein